jgi:hypothetical protein
MGADDWFRSDDWSEEDQEHFEAKLARARRASRPQYLRIKGLALLHATDDERRQAGVTLLERVLDDYADDEVAAAGAHVALARYHEEADEPRRSAAHYHETLRLQEGTSVSFGAELLLAELIVRHRFEDSYSEADELLDAVLATGSIFRVEQFRYAVARMRLARRRDRDDEAAAFALGALYLFANNQPASSYHPDVGLIRADDATLGELQDTATRGTPEAASERVEGYRGADGRVRWEWALTSRLRGVPEGSRLEAQDDFDAQAAPLIQELRDAGIEVYDLCDWSRRPLPDAASVKAVAPILLRWLDKADSAELKVTIAVALTDRRFRKLATAPLIEHFQRLRSPELNGHEWPSESIGRQRWLKDRLANALARLARDEHFDDVMELIYDPRHGRYRAYLFWALPYMKSDVAVDVALEMLGDDEMHVPALRALADMRSQRGLPVLEAIAREARPRGRNDDDELARTRIDIARRGMKKMQKAQANGTSRP